MRRFVFVSLICASILAMTACGSTGATTPTPGSNGTAVEQGVLRVAALYDISTMDVSQTTDDYMVPMNVFDRLFESEVQSDGSTAIVSSLCESHMVSDDGLTYTFTLRDEYPHLLGIDTSDVRDSVELATRYIYRLLESGKAKLRFRKDAPKVKVAYHTPCHMEKLGWSYYSIELLKMIPSVELTVLDSQCCGIAGTYGFKKENYETSQAIGEGLFRQIEATGCDVVATDCETCKWQIEMSTSKRVEHPLSILAAALDVE